MPYAVKSLYPYSLGHKSIAVRNAENLQIGKRRKGAKEPIGIATNGRCLSRSL